MVVVKQGRLVPSLSLFPSPQSFSLWSFLAGALVTLILVRVNETSFEMTSGLSLLAACPPSQTGSDNGDDKTATLKSTDTIPESTDRSALRQAVEQTSSPHNTFTPIEFNVGSSSGNSTRRFFDLALKFRTDKVRGSSNFPSCMSESKCQRIDAVNPQCRVTGHFYDTIYQRWLGPYSSDTAEPFQFLEIGYFNGKGFDTYSEFLPRAEKHSMEISCLPPGPQKEGKWPWGNFASVNKNYQKLLDARRLHCGDANDFGFLNRIWTTEMKRPDAPPLKVVIDDGSHLSHHMVQSVFFWFPRLQPGGLLFIEDIEPMSSANAFRLEFLPSLVKDLHFCGLPEEKTSKMCFPTIQPLLKSISCEMHVCVLERNDRPAIDDLDQAQSTTPSQALDSSQCRG